MQKPKLILKPSLINALTPMLVRNLVYALVVAIILFGVALSLISLSVLSWEIKQTIYWLIGFTVVVAILPLIYKLLVLANTKYLFYETHVVSEYKLFGEKRSSVPFHHVSNINVKITPWDRLCRAGDIILHAVEGKSLTLRFIRKPKDIEHNLYKILSGAKKN